MNDDFKSPKLFAIKEFERASGVSRRNIHFYVKEGLLPPPEGRGRGATYTLEHLLRLDLIRLMRESTQLRLDGIREILEPLSLEELETYRDELLASKLEAAAPYGTRVALRTLEGSVSGTPPDLPQERSTAAMRLTSSDDAAADWIEHESPLEFGVDKPLDSEDAVAPTMRPRGFRRLGVSRRPPREERPRDEAITWQRVKITEGLEIHYRPGSDSRFIRDLMGLIARAKKTFRK